MRLDILIILLIMSGVVFLNLITFKKINMSLKRTMKDNDKYKFLLNSIDESICVINNKWEYVFTNSASEKRIINSLSSSTPLKSICGCKLFDIYPNIENTYFFKMCQMVMETKIPKTITDEITMYEGWKGWHEVKIYPFEEGIMIIGIDVTDILSTEKLALVHEEKDRKLKEALEFDKLSREFFANLSHELRTPLTIILSSLQLLNSNLYKQDINILREKTVRYVKIARQNCNRLLRLINNLIDISKIDSNFFELNRKNWNIVSIIEDMVLSVADYVESNDRHIIFNTDIEEKIIACDADMIERIMLNLISNAVKFSNSGDKIDINISDESDGVNISVENTGIGIPEENIAFIFERFRQVDKSFTRNHEGSGIGLSLVKSIVEMHSGTIKVESVYGKWIRFTIKLPSVSVTEEQETSKQSSQNLSRVERIKVEFADIYSN